MAKQSDVSQHEKELQEIRSQLERYAENDPDKIKSMSKSLGSNASASNTCQRYRLMSYSVPAWLFEHV